MGARLVKFEFCPKENEQIEALVKIPQEKRSVIHGVVKDCNNNLIKDAVVKLFEKIKTSHGTKLKPLTHTFTDNCGEFLFGPLQPNKEYALKVWYDDIIKREIKFDYDDCDNCDDYDDHEECDDSEDCDCSDDDHDYSSDVIPHYDNDYHHGHCEERQDNHCYKKHDDCSEGYCSDDEDM